MELRRKRLKIRTIGKPRQTRQRPENIPLNEILPEYIAYLAPNEAATVCGCGKTNLYRYLAEIEAIHTPESPVMGFNRAKGEAGFSREVLEVLYEFSKIASRGGIVAAIAHIKPTMWRIYNDRQQRTSQRAS